jgi:arabinan endo-1,5-alpha-L-arabinosidase
METGFRTIQTVATGDIHMRDPFVFPYAKDGKYYLFGTTFADGCGDKDPLFEVYESSDLHTWTGPYAAFQPPKGFWGMRHYWAPEVFEVDGKFYMFASFKGGIGENRGTAILAADHPGGPYRVHSDGAVTLPGSECLDGTYYEDDEGQRWIVYCHEWTELYEGRIEALRLTKDLKISFGEPVTILNAAERPWIRLFGDPRIEKTGYLTDAPFLYQARNGELLLLWSSYSVPGYGDTGLGGYTVAVARSTSGRMEGPWTHDEQLLMDRNAGHSSLFRDFGGKLMICTHYPDTPHGQERPLFLPVEETANGLALK